MCKYQKKEKKIEENTLSKFDINEGEKGQLIYLYLKEKYEFFTPKKSSRTWSYVNQKVI
jgi:hypothetical protein